MNKIVSLNLSMPNYLCDITDGDHSWMIDEPVSKGGGNLAPDPFSALLGSLGSCSAITIKMYAQRKGWDVQDINIRVSLEYQVVNNERITMFRREVDIKGNLDQEQLQRLEHIVSACPISKILEGKVVINTTITNA